MTMRRDTDEDWIKVADENPYWGVLSADQFRGADIRPESRDQFFRSGQKLISDTIGFITTHVADNFKIKRALDFGCGVGRLLIPLAGISGEAVGVDVAPRMLELCQQNLALAGLKNGSVVLGDDTLSRVEGEFNFVNSYIVLQHIPPERGIVLIGRLLELLAVGGVFSLQFTYAKERKFLQHEGRAAHYYRRSGNIIHDLVPSGAAAPEGTISMFEYDLNEVMLMVMRIAGEPVMVLSTNHDGHIGMHLIGMKVRA